MKHNKRKKHVRRKRSNSAFTLIELLLVIGIIAILAAIVIMAINPKASIYSAQNKSTLRQAKELQNALVQHLIDNVTPLPTVAYTPKVVCSDGFLPSDGNCEIALTDIIANKVDSQLSYIHAIPRASNAGQRKLPPQNSGFTVRYDGASYYVDTVVPVVSIVPIESVMFAGGAQRSMMTGAVITFGELVTIQGNPFTVVQRGTNGIVDVTFTESVVNNKTVATLQFGGPYTLSNSLVDGYYMLTIDADGIAGSEVFENDFVFGDDKFDGFWRHFGDVDGDGAVGVAEFGAFQIAFGKTAPDPAYTPFFDYTLDGSVGVADFGQFRSRFGRVLGFQ